MCDYLSIIVEPTSFQLIATFLEKAGAVEGQVSLIRNNNSVSLCVKCSKNCIAVFTWLNATLW